MNVTFYSEGMGFPWPHCFIDGHNQIIAFPEIARDIPTWGKSFIALVFSLLVDIEEGVFRGHFDFLDAVTPYFDGTNGAGIERRLHVPCFLELSFAGEAFLIRFDVLNELIIRIRCHDIPFGKAPFNVLDLRVFIDDNQRVLELPALPRVHPKIRLQRQVELDTLGNIDERAP